MGSSYDQLSFEERCRLAELHGQGVSIRKIAAALDRSPSSISRELKRNAGSPSGYRPSYAEQQTKARRWSGSKLERDESLREAVLDRLARGWSPAQIVGRFKREAGHTVVGCETIYRFIYAQQARTKDGRWRLYLPRAKSKRGWRAGKGGSPALLIKDRLPLSRRPQEAQDRRQPGHWEADFMLFATYGQSVLVLHERTSRAIAMLRTDSRKAGPTADVLAQLLQPLPQALRRTLTFDNGTEFAEHYRLRALGLGTYFCDVRAPWQKGGVENAIGRLRRCLPRRTDLDAINNLTIDTLAQNYNHTPRRCLDFQTPAEVFSQVLHFEWDSTSRLPPG
jgi:IS30 family transposase